VSIATSAARIVAADASRMPRDRVCIDMTLLDDAQVRLR